MFDIFLVVRIMEVIQGAHKEPEDFISGMGDNVITNILHRLPLQDAVRTGILSKNWRFKWTMLSQLVLDDNFFHFLSKKKDNTNNYGRIISMLLLHIQGRITKFDLSISEQCRLDVDDINHWILFLSRNRIKDLTIWKSTEPPLMLPTHFFSCLELKHLKLSYCCFDPPASFYGFPNLLSLELHSSKFEIGKLEEFFTRCPMHEILNMNVPYSKSQMKITEFSKLANLKILSLFICNLDNRMFISSSSIFELVGFLPKLQELDLDFIKCKVCLSSLHLSHLFISK
ncbi:F-box/FBD/LRR-repeat protein At1g13570-like [Bidens hawaiensis]|uniref:F-box/FBD/LRR-repeat protein At1g13570-like n=1 Tax=Bidens hawaiensis TaxID=980011 RepID=UPI00404A6492